MSIYYSTGGVDDDGLVYPAEWGCDECSTYYSWPVTPGLAPANDPLQADMRALIAEHTPESCKAAQAAAGVVQEAAPAAKAVRDADYEFFESLGVHHPAEIEVTVAEAEERERLGIPLPVGGDPETDLARDLMASRRQREHRPHHVPGYRRVRDAPLALAAIQHRLTIGGWLVCRSDNTDAGSRA